MATAALIAYLLYLTLAFVGRTLLQIRRTGSSGFKGVSGRPGSAEWSGGVLFVVAWVLVLLAPLLALGDTVEPIAALDGPVGHGLGIALFVAGLAGTLVAQGVMGEAWRIGVDDAERTELVTGGLFAVVRNPIFTAMFAALLGLVLMVPSWLAITGFALLVAAIQLQVRLVEEPYLRRKHGDTYSRYTASVGRFVPGVGRSSPGAGDPDRA